MNNLTDVQSLSDIKILLEMDGPLEDGEIEAELFFMMNHFQVGQVNPGTLPDYYWKLETDYALTSNCFYSIGDTITVKIINISTNSKIYN